MELTFINLQVLCYFQKSFGLSTIGMYCNSRIYKWIYLLLFCACRAKYDAVEVTVHTTLSSSCLNKKVRYKYSIQYPNGSNYLEYIHDLSVDDDCNRCLELKKGS